MLSRLDGADAPIPMRPVLLCGALYAPFGMVGELPEGGLYVRDVMAAAYVYILAVYLASTIWFARREHDPRRWRVARFAGAAALAGAVGATAMRLVAEVVGLEHMYPNPGGLNFRIAECYACEAPWDAAARAAWFHVRLVIPATLLAPLVSEFVRRGRTGIPTRAVR